MSSLVNHSQKEEEVVSQVVAAVVYYWVAAAVAAVLCATGKYSDIINAVNYIYFSWIACPITV